MLILIGKSRKRKTNRKSTHLLLTLSSVLYHFSSYHVLGTLGVLAPPCQVVWSIPQQKAACP